MRKKKRKRQKPNEKRKIKRNGTLEEDIFVQNRGWFLFSLFFPIWRNYIWVGTGKKLLRPIRISHIFLPLPNNSHTIRPFSLIFSIPSFSTPTKHTLNFLFPFSLVSFPLIEDDLGQICSCRATYIETMGSRGPQFFYFFWCFGTTVKKCTIL